MRFRRILASAAVVAVAGSGAALMSAGLASASTTFNATTILVNRPDSGNNTDNGGFWAMDSLTRSATLVDNGPDSGKAGYDAYTLSLSDTGSFSTDAGASNPNGEFKSDLIAHQPITGTVNGSGSFTFDVLSSVHANTGGVPAAINGAGTASSDWPKLFFPGGTTIDYTGSVGDEGVFSYTYHSAQTCETWVDANTNGDGAGFADGGISGYGHCDVTVTDPGSQRTHAGDAVSLQIEASTSSSDPALTYSMSGQPAGLSINPSTGLITGTPTVVENTDIVKVTARDAYGSEGHVYFGWDVTNAQVLDTVNVSYVCGYGHPRGQYELSVNPGSYTAHVNLAERLWGGQVVGDGKVTVHPGTPIFVNANNGVALRVYYEKNGMAPPANDAGAIFTFARIPAHPRSC